ncbi:MAG: helix-turn-helix domain-containing protein [Candidatus Moranbacteria bacterium]|nr:helix-turn-helix domain-containing protein [Candidatus Moranbacteria bacterium]
MNKLSKIAQTLYTPLQELGCNDQEIEVYTTSLLLGPSPIQNIAAHLSIARPNIYKLIRSLEKKGLAQFSEKKKYARNFLVVSPSIVLEKLRSKELSLATGAKDLSLALPDILSLYRQGDMPAKVKVLEGSDQFLRIFWSILDEGQSPLRFLGSADEFIDFISWNEERKWIKERVRRNLFINVLLTPGEDAQTLRSNDTTEMRETRILSDISPFITGVLLFANKVTLWQPKAPSVILIEDEFIVQMFQNIFDHLWESSKK